MLSFMSDEKQFEPSLNLISIHPNIRAEMSTTINSLNKEGMHLTTQEQSLHITFKHTLFQQDG